MSKLISIFVFCLLFTTPMFAEKSDKQVFIMMRLSSLEKKLAAYQKLLESPLPEEVAKEISNQIIEDIEHDVKILSSFLKILDPRMLLGNPDKLRDQPAAEVNIQARAHIDEMTVALDGFHEELPNDANTFQKLKLVKKLVILLKLEYSKVLGEKCYAPN